MLKELKKGFGRVATLLAGLALTGCAAQTAETPAASAAARPALWQVSDADTTIYLFGTIHALPEGAEWRSPALDRAMAASDELVTEIRLTDQMAAAGAFARLGLAAGLPPVLERVPENKRDALRAAIANSPLPAAALDRLKTWAVAVTLAQVLFQEAGLDPERGVERVLTADFTARGKTLSALETAEEQFGFFNSLPEEAQRAFLVGVLESPEQVRTQFDAMLRAWRSGDTRAIGRTFNEEETMSAELREILLTRRNARWAEWLQRRLAQPGTVFVAVGAGHLAGENSVQDYLRQRGLTARRVQ
ncbi:MAG TPA: TraB/GumN family protein [Allosphingosinicella sp.]|jgi:hypothetical protein